MELQRLVKGAKDGNKEHFREIFDHLNNRLFAYAYSHTSNRDDALDIVQETFIALWGALKRFEYKTEEEFYGFVFTILKRKLILYYKSGKRRATVPIEGHEASMGYEMKHADYRYLLKHINSLAAGYRELLKLRYWSDMTFADIARVMNIKETTAKVRHHRAIRKLKLLIEKYDVHF